MQERIRETGAHRRTLGRREGNHPCILLADDQHVERMALADLLVRCGLSVDLAAGGEAAIARVLDAEQAGLTYDLALIDCDMPHCNGFEATRAIRIAGYPPGLLPILGITNRRNAKDDARIIAAEMQGSLVRPVTLETLVPLLNRWLPHRIVENGDQRGQRRLSDK